MSIEAFWLQPESHRIEFKVSLQRGDKTVDKLSEYLSGYGPDYKGFNRRNLYRMKHFYEAYPDRQFVSAVMTQLNWTHHMIILSKTKNFEERQFYLKLSKREGYSSRELELQIDSSIYERVMLSSKSVVPADGSKKNRYFKVLCKGNVLV